ncbi:hypothetical protein F4779DRAFT_634583 [Xylariaceae sp. FL0662B]|nr:hypothetical protein F4779DRAFT_634583 [Xylariaceae sp. FL0662B]
MDPLSAFSLAAGVVQFTEFTANLLSNTIKIYKSTSGQLSTTVELSRISRDLQALCSHIEEKAKLVDNTDEGALILRPCAACRRVNRRLETALEKLRATGHSKLDLAVNSFTVVLRSLWSKDEIASLCNWLSAIRVEMMNAVAVIVWGDGQRCYSDVRALMIYLQDEVVNTLNRIDQTTMDFRQALIDLTSGESAQPMMDDQRASVWSKLWSPRSRCLDSTALGEKNTKTYDVILNSLTFQTLTHRQDAIPSAYEKTFRWVFDDPQTDKQGNAIWSNFPVWLRGGSEAIYWVTGKPGSGKSTLMKYILNNPLLQTHLKAWAGDRRLLLGCFYFWNAGSVGQKSHSGLLKTLLFECLSQMPDLIPRVCTKRWAFYKIFDSTSDSISPPLWSLKELQETLSNLVSDAGQNFTLALFIDGLDEFEGDHKELISFLEAVHQNGKGRAKVCVSSRPWNVFSDAFKRSPGLRMEDLTHRDIEYYVRGNFESQSSFDEIRAIYAPESEHLMTLADGSSIPELQTVIDQLPEGLSDLYLNIFMSVPPKYVSDSSRFLQIKEYALEELDIMSLWLADNGDSLSIDMNQLTSGQVGHINLSMRRKVGSRTKGLLEVSAEGKVDYLHRTTHDWVIERLDDIKAKAPDEFDVHVTLLRARVVELTAAPYVRLPLHKRTEEFWRRSMGCIWHASQITKYNPNVNQVHDIVQKLVSSYDNIHRALIQDSPWMQRSTAKEKANTSALMIGGNVTPSPIADVIMAAQFCLDTYVRDKVGLDRGILHQKGPEPSVLESAIFGCLCSFRNMSDSTYLYWDEAISQKRRDLVVFLLDNGANPMQPSIRGHKVADQVAQERFNVATIDEKSYWQVISSLLKGRPYTLQPSRREHRESLGSRIASKIRRWG